MGLRKSKPAEAAEAEDWQPGSLGQILAVAALLSEERFAEAGEAFLRSLTALEEQELSRSDLACLNAALPAAFTVLAWAQNPLTEPTAQLAFGASALAARVAKLAHDDPEKILFSTPFLDHLQLWGGLMSGAWYLGSPLANQAMDNNRYVLLLGDLMSQVSELPLEHRRMWAELTARCSIADLWTSTYFQQHLQSLLQVWPLLSEPMARLLAESLLAEGQTRYGHGAAVSELSILERMLRFQQAWPPDAKSWEWQGPALGTCARPKLSPQHCLAAFMLERTGGAAAVSGLLARSMEGGFLAQCIFTAALDGCPAQVHVKIVSGLCETLCLELLPEELLSLPIKELESERRSSLRQVLVPRFCVAIGKCAAALSEDSQLARLMDPLEQWALAVSCHPNAGSSQPARRWFTFSAFFAVATIAREADLQQLAPCVLVRLLRAVSCVDIFREDSQEYRAVCLSIVKSGSRDGDFRKAMLSTLCELDAAVTAVGTSTSFAASSRLHFWLGMLSEEKLLEEILGDSVVLGTLQRIARSGHTFPRLAARALTLTILALRKGPKGPEAQGPEAQAKGGSPKCVEFWETMLEAGLQGFAAAAAADDEIFEALRGLLEMAPQAGETRALDLQRRTLKALAQRTLASADDGKALGYFKLFCAAARHLDPLLPGAIFKDGRLHELLQDHNDRKELWLRHLAARFPEKPREMLVTWLLKRHPEVAAAYVADSPALAKDAVAGGPVLSSAL